MPFGFAPRKRASRPSDHFPAPSGCRGYLYCKSTLNDERDCMNTPKSVLELAKKKGASIVDVKCVGLVSASGEFFLYYDV